MTSVKKSKDPIIDPKRPLQAFNAKTLRSAQVVLRKAVKIMNDGGTHWTQHEYEEDKYIPDENDTDGFGTYVQAYCAVGGVQAIAGEVGDKRDAAVLALSLAVSKTGVKTKLQQLQRDLAVWVADADDPFGWNYPAPRLQEYLDMGGGIEEITTTYNDTKGRTWKQIVKLFDKAHTIIQQELDAR